MKQLMPFKIVMGIFSIVVLAVLIFPLLTMLVLSFSPVGGSGFTLENYIEIFTQTMYTSAFRNSIIISLVSAIVALVFTTLATYGIVSVSDKLKDKFLVLANLTSNFAGIPLAFAYIILLGSSGTLILLGQNLGWDWLANFNIYSVTGLVIVYIYFQLPMGITLLMPIYDALDARWREAASLLGANSFQFWKKIGLPVLTPSLLGIFAIMFANAMGAYASAEALTGTSINLLSIRIANTVSGDIFARPEVGAALSIMLALILLFNMVISHWVVNRVRKVVS